MTNGEVIEVVKTIRSLANNKDSEGAHMWEKGLFQDLLQSIADGTCEDPKKCSETAMQAVKIEFDRWFA